MMRFFNWFFFSLGSLLAVTVLLYTSRTTTNWAAAGATAPAPPPSPPASSSSSPEPAGPQRFKKLVGSPLTQNAAAVVLHGARCPTDPAMLYDIDVGKAAAAAAEEGSGKKSKRKERLPHTDQFR